MIDNGVQVEFGPRDEVLKKRTRNYPQLVGKGGDDGTPQPPATPGGGAAAPQTPGSATLSPTTTTVALTGDKK